MNKAKVLGMELDSCHASYLAFRYVDMEALTNPSTSLIKNTIRRDMNVAREQLAQKAAPCGPTTAGVTALLSDAPKPTKNRPTVFAVSELKAKDLRTEPRTPTQSWRPRSTKSAKKDDPFTAPQELPSLVDIVPMPRPSQLETRPPITLAKKVSWNPLLSRTQLEQSDIWSHVPGEEVADVRRGSTPQSVYDVLADAELEPVPDDYDAVEGRMDELTYEEAIALERWEMDLEDDMVDHQMDPGEEAEDIVAPADDKEKDPHSGPP